MTLSLIVRSLQSEAREGFLRQRKVCPMHRHSSRSVPRTGQGGLFLPLFFWGDTALAMGCLQPNGILFHVLHASERLQGLSKRLDRIAGEGVAALLRFCASTSYGIRAERHQTLLKSLLALKERAKNTQRIALSDPLSCCAWPWPFAPWPTPCAVPETSLERLERLCGAVSGVSLRAVRVRTRWGSSKLFQSISIPLLIRYPFLFTFLYFSLLLLSSFF